MANMNSTEMKSAARTAITDGLQPILTEMGAIQFGDANWAVRTEIEGQEIWVEIAVRSKAFKATKSYDAFDPKTAAEAWKDEKAIKAAEKAEKEKEKAKKKA